MAFGTPVSLSATASKGSTTINLTLTSTAPAGSMVVVYAIATDTAALTISDSNLNTWSEYGGTGTAGNAIFVFFTRITAELNTTDTISVTSSNNTLGAIGAFYFTGVTKNTNLYPAKVTTGASTTLPSITTSDTIVVGTNYLSIGFIVAQGPIGDTFTNDAEYISIPRVGTSGGSATSNVTVNVGYLQTTSATGFTYNPTFGTARAYSAIMMVFQEEAENTLYWVGGTGNYSGGLGSSWALSSGGAGSAGVPSGLTNVIFDQNSDVGVDFTVTLADTFFASDELRLPKCKNFTIQNLDKKLTFNDSGSTRALSIGGNFQIDNTPNISFSGVTNLLYFYLTTDTTSTINTNGFIFDTGDIDAVKVSFVKNSTGTVTLLSNLNLGKGANFDLNNGTLDFNNYDVTLNFIVLNSNRDKTLKLGSGTLEITGNGGVWSPFLTTLDKGTSTLLFANTASNITFNPAKLDYHNIVFGGGANTNPISILDSGRFNNWTSTRTAGYSISCQLNVVFTFTNFSLSGSVGNVVNFGQTGTDPATITISKPGPWLVGANSTGSTSTGLVYTAGGGIDYLNFIKVNATSTAITAQGNMIMLFFN